MCSCGGEVSTHANPFGPSVCLALLRDRGPRQLEQLHAGIRRREVDIGRRSGGRRAAREGEHDGHRDREGAGDRRSIRYLTLPEIRPPDDEPLREQEEHHDRQRRQHRTGGEDAPVLRLESGDELEEPDSDGLLVSGR